MDLQLFWFLLIAVLWGGYFILEGFDFGVGMLLPFVGRSERDRRTMLETIGPVWDGNEVWLVVAAGATFAAFPEWYATMFSGFYIALLLIVALLIARVLSFEWREKSEHARWRSLWSGANTVASFLVPFLWGVALSTLLFGAPLSSEGDYAGSFWDLFSLYSVLAGLVFVLLCAFHGATFLTAAFFQRDVLRLLAARGSAYAIKVGYWSWLPLKQLAAARRHWHALAPGVTGFEHQLVIPQWNLCLRVMIYRKHVQHESPKNFQLDLFTPDDGHFEYYAVATNMALALPALYAFIGGRGAQEKTIAELKGEFALDVVPTRHYGANSAWQQLSILAHNLALSFQLDTIAVPRRRSRKRTYAYVLRSMRTLRFLLIARAGRLTRVGGRNVLRLSQNPATEALYARIEHALAA